MSPFVPPEPPTPPTLEVPLAPPEVGFGSPWSPADAENRDRILDWWRAWWRRVFFPWLAKFLAWLQAWLDAAAEYITLHAVNGHSWWKTVTPITRSGTTTVVIPFDQYRPILIGDLVSDVTIDVAFGQVISLVDSTHAVVEYIGDLRGLAGLSWWTTTTTISATGTTTVVLTPDTSRRPQIDDLVSDLSSALRFGKVVAVVDDTHVTVTPLGVLRGLAGFGWWTTATTIAHSGTTAVILVTGPDRLPQINDLVIDESSSSAYGEITAVADATHVTVAFVGTLQGPPGVADIGAFNVATGVLAPNAVYQAVMAGQPQMVGAFVLDVTSPCWIRVYASEAYMLADASRPVTMPLNIADDHGCYLDFVGVLSELVKTLTPGIMFTDTGSGLWLSVTNTQVAPANITVHFDYRIFRE